MAKEKRKKERESKFTTLEKDIYQLIQAPHPATFAMVKGELDGKDISVLLWADDDADKLRPVAIVASEELLQRITIRNTKLAKG